MLLEVYILQFPPSSYSLSPADLSIYTHQPGHRWPWSRRPLACMGTKQPVNAEFAEVVLNFVLYCFFIICHPNSKE